MLASRRKWVKKTYTTTRGAPLTRCEVDCWFASQAAPFVSSRLSLGLLPRDSGFVTAIALSTLETVLLLLMILHTTSHETDHDSSHGLLRDLRASEAPLHRRNRRQRSCLTLDFWCSSGSRVTSLTSSDVARSSPSLHDPTLFTISLYVVNRLLPCVSTALLPIASNQTTTSTTASTPHHNK